MDNANQQRETHKTPKLIKNRSDIGAGTRGSDMGIDALEIAAINAGNNYFLRTPYADVRTHNETIYNKVNAPFAKRITHVKEQCTRVAETVCEVLKQDHLAIVLSGDHSSALGSIAGIKRCYPEKRLGVVWLDAHADIHSPYTSPSGNVHGMPLAAALGDDNMTHRINPLDEHTIQEWEDMKALASYCPMVLPQDLVYFGVRQTEEPENRLIERQAIKNYMVHEVRHRGLSLCVNEALERLKDCDLIYLSFDVDSMDKDLVSDGTGTPVSKGFDPNEIKQIIQQIQNSGKVICLEIAEINPLLDTKGNRMGEVAFDILNSLSFI